MSVMAHGALMAVDQMKQLSTKVVQNPLVIFTTTTGGGGHRCHLSSVSQAAKPTASPSDPDVAAAQQLLQLSSDGDADDATLSLSHHREQHPKGREDAPTATATTDAGGTPKGDESDAAAPALAPRRKRRFASISSIYARTKPSRVRGSSPS